MSPFHILLLYIYLHSGDSCYSPFLNINTRLNQFRNRWFIIPFRSSFKIVRSYKKAIFREKLVFFYFLPRLIFARRLLKMESKNQIRMDGNKSFIKFSVAIFCLKLSKGLSLLLVKIEVVENLVSGARNKRINFSFRGKHTFRPCK